jgi:tetratricopeptide (TPR) repeat protein
MSLLLEALKKAELAKQAAKEQPPAGDKPLFTRDKLPDISQPMEIHSEDLSLVESAPAPKGAEKPVLELALEDPARAAPPPPPPPPQPPPRAMAIEEPEFTAPSENVERKQAQQLFEAKEMDVNPRKPFYITLGALGLFALGTVGYFWYQLQPRSPFVAPSVAAKVAALPLAAAPVPPSAVPAATTVSPPAPVASTPDSATPPAEPAGVMKGKPAAPLLRPTTTAIKGATEQQRASRRDGDVKITPARVQEDPVLLSAYQAFNAGELARARDDYQQALRNSPDNRDALLGLAAVEMQSKHYDAAERYYTRLLELDPLDAYAHAGLIGLKGQIDPVSAESRLKNMIAAQPEASFLNFNLGNQYAAQGRWTEAQQAYFRAYTGDPEHPDFAYNLAVSLDKMHQSKQALEYYRRALVLAQGQPVTFDPAQVSKRVSQLAP